MNPRGSAHTDSCLVRNACCLWILGYHAGNRTSRRTCRAHMLSGSRTRWKVVQRQKRLYDQRAVRRLFALGDWVMRYYPAGKKCKLDSIWTGPYLIVATLGWTVGIQRHPDEPVIFIHCQDVKKIPPPSGVQSWLTIPPPGGTPVVPMLGASMVAHTSRDSPR